MDEPLMLLGFVTIAVGVALVVLGTLLSAFGRHRRSELSQAKTAGAVLIGPFPIIFGDRELLKYSFALLLVFVALSLILLLFFLQAT